MASKVVKDWENRELLEIVNLNIQQLAAFLNNFEFIYLEELYSDKNSTIMVNGRLN